MGRALCAVLAAGALVFLPGHASAAAAPVVIVNYDTGPVRVQVTQGLATPCDSSANRPLWSGELRAGEAVTAATEERCVCATFTRADFPRSGWSQPGFYCRPGHYRGKRWIPDPDPTIRIAVRR